MLTYLSIAGAPSHEDVGVQTEQQAMDVPGCLLASDLEVGQIVAVKETTDGARKGKLDAVLCHGGLQLVCGEAQSELLR